MSRESPLEVLLLMLTRCLGSSLLFLSLRGDIFLAVASLRFKLSSCYSKEKRLKLEYSGKVELYFSI